MNPSIDWGQFINEILDGRYALDIRKTGNVSMFVENQLGAYSQFYTDSGAFQKALEAKWQQVEGTAASSLNAPAYYQSLLQLGTSFLLSNEVFLMTVSSLYIQLQSMTGLPSHVEANRKRLLLLCNHALVSFIESWVRKFAPIGKNDLLFIKPYLAKVVKSWKAEIDYKIMEDYHSLLGLIYLDQWRTIESIKREYFIEANEDNKSLFRSLIADFELKREEHIFNLHYLERDLTTNPDLFRMFDRRGLLPELRDMLNKEKHTYEVNLHSIGQLLTSSTDVILNEFDESSSN